MAFDAATKALYYVLLSIETTQTETNTHQNKKGAPCLNSKSNGIIFNLHKTVARPASSVNVR